MAAEEYDTISAWSRGRDGLTMRHLQRVAAVPATDGVGRVGAVPRAFGRARPGAPVLHWSERTETAALVLWDLVACLLVFSAITELMQPRLGASGYVVAITVPMCTALLGGYRRVSWLRNHLLKSLGLLLLATACSLWVQTLVSPVSPSAAPSLAIFACAPVVCVLGRWILTLVRGMHPERVLIVGGGTTAMHVLNLAGRRARSPITVVGYIDSEPFPGLESPHLGDLSDLSDLLKVHAIDRVIIAFSRRRDAEILSIVRDCDASQVDVDVVPRFFDYVGPEPRVYSMDGMAFINVRGRRFTTGQRVVKRIFDTVFAGLALLVTFPIFVAAAVAVVVESGRPVFFRQIRVGANGKPFVMIKFRTMTADVPKLVASTHEALRDGQISVEEAVQELKEGSSAAVTRTGAFLRRTSIDELPQLWNVLWGEMSLVGPRPLQAYEVAELDSWELYRHQMRPGITGLWQVTGRSELDWRERMQLDYTYVRHWSPMLDLRVLFDTVPAALRGRGAV